MQKGDSLEDGMVTMNESLNGETMEMRLDPLRNLVGLIFNIIFSQQLHIPQ